MAYRPRNKSGDKAVSFLATTAVVAGGSVALSIIVLAFSDDPLEIFAIMLGTVLGVVLLGWLLRDKKKGQTNIDNDYGWMLWRKPKKKKVKVRVKRARAALADNAPPAGPPTAESIREIRGETWVPAPQSGDDS